MTERLQIDGKPVKILVVDDEEIVLNISRDALEDDGYQIELARDGPEAAGILEQEYFDFILTDIRMPGMDGLELARKAREIIPSIGIIFMTGYANLNTAKDAIKEGAYDYIMKPFELKELRQAVRNAVKKKQKDAEKTLSTELNRLSDLNQLMYTVSDRRSLMRLSLGFAVMLGKTANGSIIFKNNSENEIGRISTSIEPEGGFGESFIQCSKDFLDFDSEALNAPFIVRVLEDHPLFQQFGDPEIGRFLMPQWHDEGYQLVNIALKRGPKLYGFLILGYPRESGSIKQSELKLLNITASQIAISLENIILLEESREAYGRLKDLQEQTIQLERLATKGQMSAEIGHELNNFLGVVSGNLSLMKHQLEQKNYDELSKYLKVVISNLDGIRKFTEGLVDFSTMKSEFETCDVNALISDIIEYLSGQKRFQNIGITFQKSDVPIFTEADVGQLQQLLYNLLNNAADATLEKKEEPNKKIVITTEFTPERNEFSISVSDNGIGIETGLIHKMLKKQFTTKKSGHGFGLLVIKRIIENHGGNPSIRSVPGEGTTITTTFPLKASVREQAAVS
jgi:signal transduction histidine kinase/CheY-like chemotaxis protein